jgi:TMEM175 potassium channel family protein
MHATKGSIDGPVFMRVSKHRLDALTDGLFAIVMTLLVLELKVPDLPRTATGQEIGRALANDGPVFVSFLITFMFAALFWYLHHALLNFIRELPGRLVALNLAFLLFVSLLPFSVGVLGHFIRNSLAQTLYFGNQFAISVLLMAMWFAARRWKLLLEPTAREARKFEIRVTALPVAAAVATGFAWINTRYSFYAFLMVVVASRAYSARVHGKA